MLEIQKMHDILLQWEQIEGGWTEEVREECIDFLSEHPDEQYWKELLESVPQDILQRYRKLIQMMKEEYLLDEEQILLEERHARTWGGKLLMKRGKQLAEELKVARESNKYVDVVCR